MKDQKNEVLQNQKWARYHANRLSRNPEDAEERAQDALLSIYEHPEWSTERTKYAVLDSIRADFGRSGSSKYTARLNFESQKRVDPETVYGRSFDKLASKSGEDPNGTIDFDRICKALKTQDRIVIKLKFEWGFKAKEIADCFGVSESRISKRLSEIQARIQQDLCLDEKKTVGEVFDFEVEWLTL